MSNSIMNPIVPGPAISKAEFNTQQVSQKEGASFSRVIENKSAEIDERQSMLGVKEKGAGQQTTKGISEKEKEEKDVSSQEGTPYEVPVTDISELLRQLMAKLKEVAEGKDAGKVGVWAFTDLDIEKLENLAETAGMDEAGITSLMMNFKENDGVIGLLNLFATLEKHFAGLGAEVPVTAPETSLPLLQTFLSKLGVPVEEVSRIAEQSVDDLGAFELGKFLQGLQEFAGSEQFGQIKSEGGTQAVTLTNWEFEQLQNMLKMAGVSDEMGEKLFPEKVPLWQKAILETEYMLRDSATDSIPSLLTKNDAHIAGLSGKDSFVQMDLERLQDILSKTITDVEAMRSKADVPAFLGELEKVLSQAGFKDGGAGWSPVVQESVKAIFQELQKMVDLAKVKVATFGGEGGFKEWSGSAKINDVFATAIDPTVDKFGDPLVVDRFGKPAVVEQAEIPKVVGQLSGEEVVVTFPENSSEAVKEMGPSVAKPIMDNNSVSISSSISVESQVIEGDVKAVTQAPRLRMRPEIQQLTLDQISQSVFRGLKNNQHQLTLTLYPKELGEVKVDMMVRDNQVSLSFLMETPKVKELLESNMQDFKDNMEQRGFSLENLSVSVEQNDDSDRYKEQFELAWQGLSEQDRKEKFTEIAEHINNNMTVNLSYHDGQINVMA